jgi:thiamine transport system ATP-binding protein
MLALEGVVVAQEDWRLTADVSIEAGTSTAIFGPSGAGKSTLLDVIAGFIEPAAGRVLWEGRDLTPLPPAARPVTLLFQDHNLFAHLTVAQNVGLGLRPDLRLDPGERARVAAALSETELAGKEGRRPGELSGGERSRVALARALLRNRPLLLLDEPFAALGPALRAEMLDLVARIRAEQGATLLMVSHAPEDARRIAGQVVMVDDGRVSAPVETGALFADPPPALRAYLGVSR